METIIVDNSNDPIFNQKIKQDFPSDIFVQSKSNVEFADGNNLGIETASGEYLLFLNNNTLVFPNSLEPMVEFLITHPEVGVSIFGVVILAVIFDFIKPGLTVITFTLHLES